MGDDDSDSEDQRGRNIGFFFGNVDEKGRLEEDYLDEVGHNVSQKAPLHTHHDLEVPDHNVCQYGFYIACMYNRALRSQFGNHHAVFLRRPLKK
jgi:hypothetical protein